MRWVGSATALACGCYHGAPEGSDDGVLATSSTSGPAPTTSEPEPTDETIDPDDASVSGESSTAADSSESGMDDTSTGERPLDPMPSCPVARAEVDRPDDSALAQIKVIYAIPQDGADAALDTSGQICNSVRGWAGWFLDRSGGRGLRLDTAGGELDIAFVRLPSTNAMLHGKGSSGNPATDVAYVVNRIEADLQVLGWLQPDTVYAVYYGGTSQYACGQGAWPPAIPGVVGAFYLNAELAGFPACSAYDWGTADLVPGYVDYAMIHEVLHVLGFAGGGAPHMSTTAHVYDGPGLEAERDVLFSPPADGGSYPGWGVYSAGGLVLDINADDYLDHGQANLPDLGASAFLVPNIDGVQAPTCDEHSIAACTDALAARAVPIAVPPPPG
jgi:hypothetical protein